jgi:hypothetical protein
MIMAAIIIIILLAFFLMALNGYIH